MSTKLTADQEKRIEATLKRIRAGLSRSESDQFDEPSHIFDPEVQNGASK